MDELLAAWGKETEAVAHTKEALSALINARHSHVDDIERLTREITEAYDRVTVLIQKRSMLADPPDFVQTLDDATKAARIAENNKNQKYRDWENGVMLDDVPKLDYDRSRYGLGVNLANKMMRTAAIMSLSIDTKAKEAMLALKLKNQQGWKRGLANRNRVTKYLKKRGVWASLVTHFGSHDLVVGFLGLKK